MCKKTSKDRNIDLMSSRINIAAATFFFISVIYARFTKRSTKSKLIESQKGFALISCSFTVFKASVSLYGIRL